uniref:Uncharacterized protein n=1 Tax=Nelumbo nucifera TaxID=4432 RepID=A0A822ZAX7_NELNU|nr:TPA_asm: hypothetical protein HUJ06_015094 [Nelumbo nucifera]
MWNFQLPNPNLNLSKIREKGQNQLSTHNSFTCYTIFWVKKLCSPTNTFLPILFLETIALGIEVVDAQLFSKAQKNDLPTFNY